MPPTNEPPFSKLWPWVCFVTSLYLLNCVGRTILGPLLEPIELGLGIQHVEATSILLWQAVGFSLGMLCSGFCLGYVQPRQQASFSLIFGGIFLVFVPLSDQLWSLRLLIAAFGLFAGMYVTAGMAVMHSFITYKNWGKAISIHQLAPHVSFICTPLMANFFLTFMSWRACLSLIGLLCIMVGGFFLLFGRGGHQRLPRMSFKGFAQIVASPTAILIMFFMIMGMSGEFAIFSLLPLYMTSELNLDLDRANYILSLSRLLCPFFVLIGGVLVDRLPPRPFVGILLVLHALCVWLISVHSVPVAVAGIALQGVVVALYAASAFKMLAEIFPAERQPVILAAVMPLGSLIAVGVIPNLFGYAGDVASFSLAFRLYGVFGLLVASLLWPLSVLAYKKNQTA